MADFEPTQKDRFSEPSSIPLALHSTNPHFGWPCSREHRISLDFYSLFWLLHWLLGNYVHIRNSRPAIRCTRSKPCPPNSANHVFVLVCNKVIRSCFDHTSRDEIKDETCPTRLREAVMTNSFKRDLWRNAKKYTSVERVVLRGHPITAQNSQVIDFTPFGVHFT